MHDVTALSMHDVTTEMPTIELEARLDLAFQLTVPTYTVRLARRWSSGAAELAFAVSSDGTAGPTISDGTTPFALYLPVTSCNPAPLFTTRDTSNER